MNIGWDMGQEAQSPVLAQHLSVPTPPAGRDNRSGQRAGSTSPYGANIGQTKPDHGHS